MDINSNTLHWLLDKRYRWVQHLMFWAVMYSPHILIALGVTGKAPESKALLVYLCILFLDTGLIYLNLYFFIPKFFVPGRFFNYAGLTMATVAVNSWIGPNLVEVFIKGGEFEVPKITSGIVNSFVINFAMTVSAAGLNIGKRFLNNQIKLKEMETTSLRTELEYLKNQINPHFLFNSLNNIYVQTRSSPAQASEAILQLSDLLRYQLYDCAQENVWLHDEINYIQNYLKLDRMRKNESQIDFSVSGNPGGIKIAPFLFVPFVENAIKHSIGLENAVRINISFDVRPNEIFFRIENSKPELGQLTGTNRKGGIGLANISRRLDLLYPGKYKMEIDNGSSNYIVSLRLITS